MKFVARTDLFFLQRYGTEVISAELKNSYAATAAGEDASFMSAILPPATMI